MKSQLSSACANDVASLRTRSTISRHNPASLRSHQAVADFAVFA